MLTIVIHSRIYKAEQSRAESWENSHLATVEHRSAKAADDACEWDRWIEGDSAIWNKHKYGCEGGDNPENVINWRRICKITEEMRVKGEKKEGRMMQEGLEDEDLEDK